LNALRKKQQDSILDYQDQIESLNKKNAKIDRERERLQHEVIELTATVDQVQKDKLVAEKAAEKFENEARELANKAEDLIMHVNDLIRQRNRLQLQNNDLLKELHDVKIQVDNLQHVKQQLVQQLDETTRRLEEAESDRGQMQANCTRPNWNWTLSNRLWTMRAIRGPKWIINCPWPRLRYCNGRTNTREKSCSITRRSRISGRS
jgi:chromosome segregation ATPase